MKEYFKKQDEFIRYKETTRSGRIINHTDKLALEKFMKSKGAYNTILFEGDEAFSFEDVAFDTMFLSFATSEHITFDKCTFLKDTIIRNEGTGTIDVFNSTLGEKTSTSTGHVVCITGKGNIVMDKVNGDQVEGSLIKLRAREGIIYMHDVNVETPIAIESKMLHLDECDSNMVLLDVKRYINTQEDDQKIPTYIHKKN